MKLLFTILFAISLVGSFMIFTDIVMQMTTIKAVMLPAPIIAISLVICDCITWNRLQKL